MAGIKGKKHISVHERAKIEALFESGKSAKEIAEYLKRSPSTIYKELKRGNYTKLTTHLLEIPAYSADIAQQDYNYKATAKGSKLKIGSDFAFVQYVESKIIDEKYSPYATLMKLKAENCKFKTKICFKTLYNYINSNLFINLTSKNLPRQGKNKRKTDVKSVARSKNKLCLSIEDRPKNINKRSDFGHWEMDTVVGKVKGKGPALLVLTERLTRKEIILKMKNKTANSTVQALNRIEREFGVKNFRSIFKTITVDNGSEFMDCQKMEKSYSNTKTKRTNIYYCHPYSAWERGSNENTNALIRRFIPKGTPIDNYSNAQISKIEQWINHYPRKILNGKCSEELFLKYLAAI